MMNTRTPPVLLAAGATLLSLITYAPAFDAMYEKTGAGDIEIKQLPQRTALRAAKTGSYFQEDNRLFSSLFDYIKKNDVAMTVPVEAEIDQAEMRFFASPGDAEGDLGDTSSVTVETWEAREVVSVGLRGAYNEEQFKSGKQMLNAWLLENTDYEATGPAYAVYWNGPYVPNLFKRSEVHLPIARAAGEINPPAPAESPGPVR